MSTRDQKVGYRNPPEHCRFRKGQSGNPAGRPKGSHRTPPHDTVLGQLVTIRENGTERRVTAAEALLLQLVKRGLDGDATAAALAITAIETVRAKHVPVVEDPITIIRFVSGCSLNSPLEDLRMARTTHRYRPNARIRLEPWIVEAALARLPQPLSREDQAEVVANTRTPHRVKWPDWWEVRPTEPQT